MSEPIDLSILDELLEKWPMLKKNAEVNANPAMWMLAQLTELLIEQNKQLGDELTQANIDYLQATNGGRDLSGYDR